MTELARQLIRMGHEVKVVTAFPHYNTNRIWADYRGKIVEKEDRGALAIYRTYLYVPREKTRILGRILNYVSFNVLSTLIGLVVSDCDVILAPSPPLTIGLSAFTISLLKGIPYVYNVQDIYPDIAIRIGVLTNRHLIKFFQAVERFVYDRAAAVAVLSRGFRRNLLDKKVPSQKIAVIPNFVDSDFVKPLLRDNDFAQEKNLDGKYVVLYAGNVGNSQGLNYVLDAAQLLSTHPEILLLIVGNGTAKLSLEQKTKKLDLDNVRFLPFQPMESVPEMYASANLCLVPLRHGIAQDSVPSKVYTIMAAGKPLVAAVDAKSDTWGLVRETGCGIVVPPEDPKAIVEAILWMKDHPEQAYAMGMKGRARVEEDFTPEAVAVQYEKLFQKVVEQK
jgi:colanic acid biosynthesis glycosyl transferase WcaI